MRRASSKALSSTSLTARETFGCCAEPSIDGFVRSVASACGAEARRVRHQLLRQLLVEQSEQQVLGVELRVAHAARQLLGGGDRLLGFQGQFVEVHFRSGSWVGS